MIAFYFRRNLNLNSMLKLIFAVNINMISQIIFSILLVVAIFLFSRNMSRLRRNIMLGKKLGEIDQIPRRWRLVVLNALGQKKMFARPIPAILHFFVYAGFIIINIEIMEIVLDGLFNTHRLFAPFLGGAYTVLISSFEVLAVLVLVSCVIFLIRRHLMGIKRFYHSDLKSWPRLDANIILATEIVLMSAFLLLDTADLALQHQGAEHYHQTGNFLISGLFAPALFNMDSSALIGLERAGWWFHILGVFAFLNYLPISKHLHIILSFPNTYYSKLTSMGKMPNMPDIAREVQLMLNPDAFPAEGAIPEPAQHSKFGAQDINDLSWRDILGAYSCTECGRCTSVCPANLTGKKLSPRKIMMDTRDRAEEVGRKIDLKVENPFEGKMLLNDYITKEELLACTSCQACVEACPVNIDPLTIIHQLKRYVIMEEAASPQPWNIMFSNVENNQAPWQFSPSDRFNWAEGIETKSGQISTSSPNN